MQESFGVVCKGADFIVVEDVGSLGEINLRSGDVANVGFAMRAVMPVILFGDIDRGGVIALLVGTYAVLLEEY